MTDTLAPRAAIEKSGLKYSKIAEKMSITAYTLQKKICNITEFKASEISKLANLLSLSSAEIDYIFFSARVIINHQSEVGA